MAKRVTKKQLKERATQAAEDMQELAASITNAIDMLPRFGSKAVRRELEQQGRRAKAISAALVVESTNPDPHTVGHLRAAATYSAAAVLVLCTGSVEKAGSDAWDALAEKAASIVADSDPTSTEAANDSESSAPKTPHQQTLSSLRSGHSD